MNWTSSKICASKDTVNNPARQPTQWEKLCANHSSAKGLVSRIYKNSGLGEREEGKGRERNIDLLFHLFMHSLVDSRMCLDQGSNPQPWRIWMML